MDNEVNHSRTTAEARLDLPHYGRERDNVDRARKVRIEPRQVRVAPAVGNSQGAIGIGNPTFEPDPIVGDLPLLSILARRLAAESIDCNGHDGFDDDTVRSRRGVDQDPGVSVRVSNGDYAATAVDSIFAECLWELD